MNNNFERRVNKLYVIAFFLGLSVFALAQVDRAIFISWVIFKPENTKKINQYLPSSWQIRPSLAHRGQEGEYSKIRDVVESRSKDVLPALDRLVELSYTVDRLFLTANAHFQLLLGKHTIQQKRHVSLFGSDHRTYSIAINEINYGGYRAQINPRPYIDYLQYFAHRMQQSSIDVLYVKRPSKNEATEFSPRIEHFINRPSLSDLVYEGIKGNIDHIDLMDYWESSWGDVHNIFFKTDHHWNQLSAFRFFQRLSLKLSSDYNISVDAQYTNLENYDQISIPKAFLGTTGRYVGYAGGELDDALFLSPLFPTSFDVKRTCQSTSTAGSFDQAFYDVTYLPPSNCHFNGNAYGVYNYREHSLIVIKNKMIRNKKKLVTINDSFSSSLVPFLSLFFEEVHMVDTRLYSGNLIDYIEKQQPDLVLILLRPDLLGIQLSFPRCAVEK